jgi:hypothetical protein
VPPHDEVLLSYPGYEDSSATTSRIGVSRRILWKILNGNHAAIKASSLDVALLYFDGCPNHADTLVTLEALLSEAGWDGDVQLVNVDTKQRAEELRFRGSPTVLIDGEDPFLDTDAPFGLSCRIYPAEESFRGSPPESELRAAIARSI